MYNTIQIHFLEILVSLLGKVNAGIDRAQEVINSPMDVCQYRATKALNDRLELLADELLNAALAAGAEPNMKAAAYDRELESYTREYEQEVESLARGYEAIKAQIAIDRAITLSQRNLDVAQEISDAYLAERRDILNRKK